MFVVEAIFPFSALTMKPQNVNTQNAQQKELRSEQQKKLVNRNQNQDEAEKEQSQKRPRSKSQQKQLLAQGGEQIEITQLNKQKEKQQVDINGQEIVQIQYLSFDVNEKILVRQTLESGWWFGNTLKHPELKGYFPSTYVKVGAKPSPPAPPASKPPQEKEDIKVFDPNMFGQKQDWIQKELISVNKDQGPVKSQYYSGIVGHKMVKIDEKNQNILKGNHVKFDVNTGMAMVPIKDQAPTAKAVRQMGYYFDYHQWNEQKNRQPQAKSRPDPRKKKQKKLNLRYMD